MKLGQDWVSRITKDGGEEVSVIGGDVGPTPIFEPSVPLSAIRALVQQWREKVADAQKSKLMATYTWAAGVNRCADELAALCHAPTEDRR